MAFLLKFHPIEEGAFTLLFTCSEIYNQEYINLVTKNKKFLTTEFQVFYQSSHTNTANLKKMTEEWIAIKDFASFYRALETINRSRSIANNGINAK